MAISPIKIIDSGNVPTTENLSEGQIAFGTVDGETKLYGSDGTTVTDLTTSGEQGPQGPAGEDGITPTIGDNGNWFLGETDTGKPSRGEQGPKGEQGDPGPQGKPGQDGTPGATGAPGAAATITVGTTTTGDAGTEASVTNSGTTSAVVLNFTIPKGEKGDKGDKGDTGPAGADGEDGAPGPAGTDGANGKDGAAATITVGETTTGKPGTQASVTNSGSASAAVFNFTIPKGEKGDTGPAGTTTFAGLADQPTDNAALKAALDAKASQTDLEALQTTVAGKADTSALANYATKSYVDTSIGNKLESSRTAFYIKDGVNVYCQRVGNIVMLSANGTGRDLTTTFIEKAAVPAKYRPHSANAAQAIVRAGLDVGRMAVAVNGDMYFWFSNVDTSANITFNMTYAATLD